MQGITFNNAMALAVLNGDKNTTRRVAKCRDVVHDSKVANHAELKLERREDGSFVGLVYLPSRTPKAVLTNDEAEAEISSHALGYAIDRYCPLRRVFLIDEIKCPYRIGQEFYLRENHWKHETKDFAVYHASPAICAVHQQTGNRIEICIVNFRFTMDTDVSDIEIAAQLDKRPHWHRTAARFLPEVLSRCVVKVTGLGFCRLRNIEGDEFRREGVMNVRGGYSWHQGTFEMGKIPVFSSPLLAFQDLWKYLHGPNTTCPAPWDTNPPVWIVRFVARPARVQERLPQFANDWFGQRALPAMPSMEDPALPQGKPAQEWHGN